MKELGFWKWLGHFLCCLAFSHHPKSQVDAEVIAFNAKNFFYTCRVCGATWKGK